MNGVEEILNGMPYDRALISSNNLTPKGYENASFFSAVIYTERILLQSIWNHQIQHCKSLGDMIQPCLLI